MVFYTYTCGGLGDILFNYFNENYDAGYFADIKRHHPNLTIRVSICSVNSNSQDFFTYNPHIDQIKFAPFIGDHVATERILNNDASHIHALGLSNFIYQKPLIYLDDEEQKVATEMVKEPFVCIHPFAGTPERAWTGKIDLKLVVDMVCDQGMRVVVVGGNHKRTDPTQWKDVVESFNYTKSNLYNLVNQHSVRLHAYLVSKSAKFIGTQSAYCVVAHFHDVPSLIFTDYQYKKEYCENGLGIFGKLYNSKLSDIHFWQKTKNVKNIINEFIL
jgi:ADP-heptose:LPS heptosyltransferase